MHKKKKLKSALQAGCIGAGMALSQIALAGGGSCSVTSTGRCSACGGCVVALAGLAGWALWRQNRLTGSGEDA